LLKKLISLNKMLLMKFHLYLSLQNPLVGHNDERFGPRFPAVSNIYTKSLRDLFKKIAQEKNIAIKEGVYSSLGGPCYETVSEVRGLLMLGADAAGMSTAHEALVASYCGMKVLAVAVITNVAIMDYDSEAYANHEEVIEMANKSSSLMEDLITGFVVKHATTKK
jgi:purine-nucleoside phosphorylase